MNMLHVEMSNLVLFVNVTMIFKAGISNLEEKQWGTSEIHFKKCYFSNTSLLRITYFMSETKEKKV